MKRYLLAGLVLTVATFSFAAEGALKTTENGSPKIESIDAITFGPEGTLLIGDGKASQVIAIKTGDTKAKAWKADAIAKIDEKIAGKLGTTAKNIEIVTMAVNRASGTAYVVVRKQDEKKSVIVTVDGDGKIGEFSTEKVDYVAVPLPRSGKEGAKITDLAFAKGRILVSGLAKEEFACKVFSIPTPLDPTNKATGFSTETYHVAHGKWETRAPMSSIIPYERDGKSYVVGAFACTPVVRYPLDDIKSGAKVKGSSVVELGHGNRPLNMFTYKKGDKDYILINNYRNPKFGKAIGGSLYWVARIDMAFLDEAEKVNEKAQWRVKPRTTEPVTDKVKVADEYSGTQHMDKLNDKQAVVIQEKDKVWTLKALDLP